jgi:ERCC4-type nuclease
MSNYFLIADSRERKVTAFLEPDTFVEKQLTIGDYSIVDSDGSIYAVFERKSLSDFSASLKDGRYANKNKMLELRKKSPKIKLLYIVEGEIPTDPEDKIDGIKWLQMEAALDKMLMVQDICTIYTRSAEDTAGRLKRFLRVMDKHVKLREPCVEGADEASLLTERPTKLTDHEVMIQILTGIKGIGGKTAKKILSDFEDRPFIDAVINGKSKHLKLFVADCNITAFLRSIPGVGPKTASDIIKEHGTDLKKWEVPESGFTGKMRIFSTLIEVPETD